MKDALGQEVQPGDFIIYSRSKKFKLAVVTELFQNDSIDTLRPEFTSDRHWNAVTRVWDIQQRKVSFCKQKLQKGLFVKVDPNTHLTIDIQDKRYWWPAYADKQSPEYFHGLQTQIQLFEYIRQNHQNKKLKIPQHLKNL